MLVSRSKQVKAATDNLMVLVVRDAGASIAEAGAIPVSDDNERVIVSEAVLDRMARRKTRHADKQFMRKNVNDIQTTLAYRKTVLEMMNANYSRKVVGDVEPITVNEARRVIQHK